VTVEELLSQLVAIDSVNPTLVSGGAGEEKLARFVARWFESRGIEAEYESLGPGRANVTARVRGRGDGRSLMLNAHLDTVGLAGGDASLKPRVDGRRMYGRGAYDMKASLAAIMLVADEARSLGLAGDLIVTAVADEEALSIGSERVAATLRCDAAIVTEPTSLELAIAHRGFVWLEVETRGHATHGSRYDLGVDAIAKMGPTLAGITELERRFADGGELHPLLGRASVHASLIEGGTELSTYPDRCAVRIERRTLPGETVAGVEEELRALAGDATVRSFFSREPLATPADAQIVSILRKHADAGEPIGVPFWTDAALFAEAGIPTVIFGPHGEGAHAETEWVDLDSAERVRNVLLATAREFCR